MWIQEEMLDQVIFIACYMRAGGVQEKRFNQVKRSTQRLYIPMLKEVRLGNGCAWTNIVLARQNMFSFTCKSLVLSSYKENCKDIPKQECHTTYDKKCKDIPHEVKIFFLYGTIFIIIFVSSNKIFLQKCHTTYTEQCESIPKQLCQVKLH